MSMFTCGCGNDESFQIMTHGIVGNDGEVIELIICNECKKGHRAVPSPAYIEPEDE